MCNYGGLCQRIHEYTENQVCKLFELTDGAVTWDMSAMP